MSDEPPGRDGAPSPSAALALDGCRVRRLLQGQVEIVEAEPRDRRFPVRVSESLGLVLKHGPAHEVIADGRVLRYPPDGICVRPPGCVWSTASTGPASFLSIDVDPALLPEGGVGGAMGFVEAGRVPGWRAHVEALLGTGSALRQQAAVVELITGLVDLGFLTAPSARVASPVFAARAAERAREMLTSQMVEPPSLHALAEAVGANRFVLLRAFRARFGLPPHAFVLQLRVERARAMLARGAAVAEVAQALGFADQSHLTRIFTRTVGIAPASYRRQVNFVQEPARGG